MDDGMFERVKGIIATEIQQPTYPIEPDTMFIDLPGWDSVTSACVILSAEREFGVTVKTRNLDKVERVEDLVDLLASSAPRG